MVSSALAAAFWTEAIAENAQKMRTKFEKDGGERMRMAAVAILLVSFHLYIFCGGRLKNGSVFVCARRWVYDGRCTWGIAAWAAVIHVYSSRLGEWRYVCVRRTDVVKYLLGKGEDCMRASRTVWIAFYYRCFCLLADSNGLVDANFI